MTNSTIVSQLPAVTNGLTSYIRNVRESSPLTAEEEFRLALAYREKMTSKPPNFGPLPFAVGGFSGPRLHWLRLGAKRPHSRSNIGLLKAVQKFDPERGARLATFAVYWIRAEIHEFIMRNWRIIKIATTKAQRKMFFT